MMENSCWFIKRTQNNKIDWLVQDNSIHYFDEWSHAVTTFFSEARAFKRIMELIEEDKSVIFELVKYDVTEEEKSETTNSWI